MLSKSVEILYGLKKRETGVIKNVLKNSNIELGAFYSQDFLYAKDEKIGAFIFKFDQAINKFVLPANEEFQYDFETVMEDDDFFLLLTETRE